MNSGEQVEGEKGRKQWQCVLVSEVCSIIVPQKQTMSQGFMCKLFIEEVLPGEISKWVGGCRTEKAGSQAGYDFKRSPDLVLWGAWNINYTLEFLSSEGKGFGFSHSPTRQSFIDCTGRKGIRHTLPSTSRSLPL